MYLYPWTLEHVFCKSKNILLGNHGTMVKIRKLMLIQHYYLIYSRRSFLTDFHINVLYSKFCFSLCPNQLVFLDSVTDNSSLVFLVLYDLEIPRRRGQLFDRMSLGLGQSDVSLWLNAGYACLTGIPELWGGAASLLISRRTRSLSVPLLAMWTSPRLGRCLPGFPEVAIFTSVIIKYPEGDSLKLPSSLFQMKLSLVSHPLMLLAWNSCYRDGFS